MIYLCFRQRKQRDFIRKFEKLRNQGQTIVYRFFDVRCHSYRLIPYSMEVAYGEKQEAE